MGAWLKLTPALAGLVLAACAAEQARDTSGFDREYQTVLMNALLDAQPGDVIERVDGVSTTNMPLREATRSTILNADFDFNVTPNWKVQGRSGYDFKEDEFVTTEINILRDFDCWEMRIRWVPFGQYQSYGFDLYVKSGRLRDLLRIRQPRAEVRDRFRNLLN